MSRNPYRVCDELWEKIVPLLPKHQNTHRFGGGRPRADDRTCMDAIFFVLRTGCQWNALNATSRCPSGTAHDQSPVGWEKNGFIPSSTGPMTTPWNLHKHTTGKPGISG